MNDTCVSRSLFDQEFSILNDVTPTFGDSTIQPDHVGIPIDKIDTTQSEEPKINLLDEKIPQIDGADDIPEEPESFNDDAEDIPEEPVSFNDNNPTTALVPSFHGVTLRNETIPTRGFQNICYLNSILNGCLSLGHFRRIVPALDDFFGTHFGSVLNGDNDQLEWLRERIQNVNIDFLFGQMACPFEALIALFRSIGLTPDTDELDYAVKLKETTTCVTCSHTDISESSADFGSNGFLILPTTHVETSRNEITDINSILTSFTSPPRAKEHCQSCKKLTFRNKKKEILNNGKVLIIWVTDRNLEHVQKRTKIQSNRSLEVNGQTYALKSVVEYNGSDHYTSYICENESWTFISDMRKEYDSPPPLHPYILFYELEEEINSTEEVFVEADEPEFDCDMCEDTFYSQAGFQEHRVKKHGAPMESWTDGPILEDAFEEPTADVNVEHEDHSNFPAEELDQLGEEFDVNRPIEDIETEEEVEENTNVSESARNPIVECLKCGSNVTASNLKKHQKTRKCSNANKSSNTSTEKVTCEICNSVVSKHNLKQHQRSVKCASKRSEQDNETSNPQVRPSRVAKETANQNIKDSVDNQKPKQRQDRMGISKPQYEIHDKDIEEEIFEYKVPSLLDQKPCEHCEAVKYPNNIEPANFCCSQGRINIEIPEVPETLKELLENDQNFKNHIRKYNNSLALATWGCDALDHKTWPNFKFQGKCYHAIGALKPDQGQPRKFAQWYIHDGSISAEEEAQGRIQDQYGSVDLKKDTMIKLQTMLHEVNPYIHDFKTIGEFPEELIKDVKFILKKEGKAKDQENIRRKYNLPTTEEVALITLNDSPDNADVQIQLRSGGVKHINDTNYHFDQLHYVLLFPFGKPGWTYTMTDNFGKALTCAKYYKHLLQIRNPSKYFNNIHRSAKLFAEFVCTAFYKVERQRLKYARDHQTTVRTMKLDGLLDAIHWNDDNEKIGEKIYLSSSHYCSPRWYKQR